MDTDGRTMTVPNQTAAVLEIGDAGVAQNGQVDWLPAGCVEQFGQQSPGVSDVLGGLFTKKVGQHLGDGLVGKSPAATPALLQPSAEYPASAVAVSEIWRVENREAITARGIWRLAVEMMNEINDTETSRFGWPRRCLPLGEAEAEKLVL